MSVSPSSSPRRMLRPQQQQQQHASPLATQHRNNDDDIDTYDYYNAYGSSAATPQEAPPTPTKDRGRGGDRGGFYQISLSDGPGAPAQKAQQAQQQASPRPAVDHLRSPSSVFVSSSSYQPYQAQTPSQTQSQHSRAQSYSQGYNRNDNYGYRPSYAAPSPSAAHTCKLSTGNLRPVQEYHNAFANGDTTYAAPSPSITASPTLPRPPSTSASPAHSPTPSTSSSHFATLSSASRAFLEHRRQQSIPNLLPSIQSIGRNLGRAISPDRSLRSFQQSSRPAIPTYRDERASDDDDDDSESSEEYSDSEDGDDYDSEDDEDDSRRNSSNMGFTGDARPSRRGDNSYTTFKSRNSNNNNTTPSKGLTESPSVAAGFSNWLSGGSKATSPDRAAFLSTSRTTTPEPTNLVLRGGPASGASPTARRAMSVASDMSATPRSSVTVGASTTSPSRFSQLATSMTATLNRLTQQQSPVSPRTLGASFENDEFYNMDLDAALFPAGQPSDRDAFSPSAFKNLETNALGALRKMQSAYRQRAVAHHDLAAEKSVRDEELEEAETRAQHLKMQLEGMARRAADQQKEMQILMDELAAEKKARAHERAMLLQGMPTTPTATATASTASTILSEDLGVDEAQRDQKHRRNAFWRRRSLKSNGSSYDGNNYTDDGDENDNDEEAEISSALDEDERSNGSSSVFSRSRSPTFTPSINLSLDHTAAGEQQHQVAHPRVAALGSGAGAIGSMRLPSSGNRSVSSASTATVVSSTFQKLMKNVTAAIKDEEPFSDRLGGGGSSSCRNCRGEDVSFAWNTVSVLRDENKHLKQRVGQLEVAVEGALDMVNGVGL